MLNRPDKDALRAMLESQVQEKLQHDPDAVTMLAFDLTSHLHSF
jgi:hypothetical protein